MIERCSETDAELLAPGPRQRSAPQSPVGAVGGVPHDLVELAGGQFDHARVRGGGVLDGCAEAFGERVAAEVGDPAGRRLERIPHRRPSSNRSAMCLRNRAARTP